MGRNKIIASESINFVITAIANQYVIGVGPDDQVIPSPPSQVFNTKKVVLDENTWTTAAKSHSVSTR